MDVQKTKAVVSLARPTNVTEVHNFLSLAKYYRRFVEDFSKLAIPLSSLTKKNVKFVWLEKCKHSF